MDQAIVSAITQAANEAGVDPAFALSVAERESSFDPNAHASKTIYGLFQMSADERNRWGGPVANSSDPYTQASMWMRYINGQVKPAMQQYLGREPTNNELYLGHYFGENRASRMIAGSIDPSTHVSNIFTPQEMAGNPNFARAGTAGNLTSSINADMDARQHKFGLTSGPSADPSRYDVANAPPQTASPETSGFSEYQKAQIALAAGTNTATDMSADHTLPAIGSSLAELGKGVEALEEAPQAEQIGQQAAALGGENFANARMAANYRAASAAQRPISLPGNEVDVAQYGVPASPMRPGQANLPQVIGQPQQQPPPQQQDQNSSGP